MCLPVDYHAHVIQYSEGRLEAFEVKAPVLVWKILNVGRMGDSLYSPFVNGFGWMLGVESRADDMPLVFKAGFYEGKGDIHHGLHGYLHESVAAYMGYRMRNHEFLRVFPAVVPKGARIWVNEKQTMFATNRLTVYRSIKEVPGFNSIPNQSTMDTSEQTAHA